MNDPEDLPAEQAYFPENAVESFRQFVYNTGLVYLDTDEDTLEKETKQQANLDILKNFLTDVDSHMLILIDNSQNVKSEGNKISLWITFEKMKHEGAAIALSKKKRLEWKKGEPLAKFNRLINVICLGDLGKEFNPYELTESYIQNSFLPIFTNMKNFNTDDKNKEEEQKNLSLVKKKLSDLHLTLIKNKKMMELSDLNFNYPDEIKHWILDQKSKGLEIKVESFPKEIIENSSLINVLNDSLTDFSNKIGEFLQIYNKKVFESVLEEIQFYELYEDKLKTLKELVDSNEINCIVEVLKLKKKSNFKTTLENEVNVKGTHDGVTEINNYLKNSFPISDLLTANTIEQVFKATKDLQSSLDYLVKNLRAYPPNSICNLFKSVSNSCCQQVKNIWKEEDIFQMNIENLKNLHKNSESVISALDNCSTSFKKELQTKFRIAIFTPLEESITESRVLRGRIKKIKQAYDKINSTIGSVETIKKSESESKEERLFEAVKPSEQAKIFSLSFDGVDLLDTSKEGDHKFAKALEENKKLMDEFELSYTEKITERLGIAHNEEEMYRIYRIYHPLLAKSTAQNSAMKFKDQLAKSFDAEYEGLKEKKKINYNDSNSKFVADFYDIPSTTGAIIWNNQIFSKMKDIMEKSNQLLGDNTSQGNIIKKKKEDFQEWSKNYKEQENKSLSTYVQKFDTNNKNVQKKKIFTVEKVWGSQNNHQLAVNYDDDLVEQIKDLRNILKSGPQYKDIVNFSISYDLQRKDWPLFRSA